MNVELTTSPYYHPILPLLIDTRSAQEASPYLTLPNLRYAYPEDAREQLASGLAFHANAFGRAPAGLWPSEGALSHEVCGLLVDGGWRWAATDEALLAGSLGMAIERDGYGHVTNPKTLYQPYRFGDSELTLVFRDRNLADRIGFVYRHMGGREAADDLIHRLHVIRDRLDDSVAALSLARTGISVVAIAQAFGHLSAAAWELAAEIDAGTRRSRSTRAG